MEERGCDSCKFEEQQVDPNDTATRCGNCLWLTRKGREYFPSWESKEDDDDGHTRPIIHYI